MDRIATVSGSVRIMYNTIFSCIYMSCNSTSEKKTLFAISDDYSTCLFECGTGIRSCVSLRGRTVRKKPIWRTFMSNDSRKSHRVTNLVVWNL
jgi:hypothetical protein